VVRDAARMEFFCYHRDRAGSTPLRSQMVELHWGYMDRFDAAMIARGPTYGDDGTLTGSVHILDLADPAAARRFAFEEPCYQAGAYRDVMIRRWSTSSANDSSDVFGRGADMTRYLVLGFTEPSSDTAAIRANDDVLLAGTLWSDDATVALGAAALVEARDAETAGAVLANDLVTGVEVHRWRVGGRPR